jgi:hypothetical protein
MFGVPAFVLWVAFAVLWIFDPGILSSIWHWLLGLPQVPEIILWIVFLPWALGLFVWQSSLELWLRVVIIFVIAVATGGTAGSRSWSKARARRRLKKQYESF